MKAKTALNKAISLLVSSSMLASCLSAVPFTAYAAAGSSSASAAAAGESAMSGVALGWNKTVRDNGDGTYTLTLAAQTEVSHTALSTDIYAAENGFYEVPEDGDYIIQVWGADGGKGSDVNAAIIGSNIKEGGKGGKGGYVEGTVSLKKGQKIAYTIGSNGSTTVSSGIGGGINGNGGTHGGYGSYGVGGGGGYTAVYVYDEDEEATYSHSGDYILIAGGGGGGGAGHSSQLYTPDGGAAGNIKTSANAVLTSEQNNVAGTYYAGSNGKSNSNNTNYVGNGATNLPGAENSSVFGVISATAGNDWTATYNPDKEGGLGGDGNGRGGAGGAGFAGGGGGVQATFITAWDCGGGGGGSSFAADSVNEVEAEYADLLVKENKSKTGGSVVIIPLIANAEDIKTLGNAEVSGEISEYFDIVSANGGTFDNQTKTFSFNVDLEPTLAEKSEAVTVSVTVKPIDGFAGGNSVPVLEGMTVESEKYTFAISEKADTDFVNVPWNKKVLTNTVFAEAGQTINTSDLYTDDSGRENVGNDDNYGFIKSISDYTVEGIDGETFTAPDETSYYTVSYTVEAKNAPAKVGTPVNGTYSAKAAVDVSGMEYVSVDGSRNGYKKILRYNSDGTYTLSIEHTIGVAEGIGSDVSYTDKIEEVYTNTTAGEDTYEITEDGYYLILLRGADGGDGGDTCSVGVFGGGHKHGYGGIGAAGGYAVMLGEFSKNDVLSLSIGTEGNSADDVEKSDAFSTRKAIAEAGSAGAYTAVSFNGQYLAVASGGAGGGGSFSYDTVGSEDTYSHGYSAVQYQNEKVEFPKYEISRLYEVTPIEINIDECESTNGENAAEKSKDYINKTVFEAGISGKSLVYADYAVENFNPTGAEAYYKNIVETEEFKQLIATENITFSERAHGTGCSASSICPDTSLKQEYLSISEMNDTPGVKIYKITRTKHETIKDGATENLTLSGRISKYFDIKDVKAYRNGAEDGTINAESNGSTFTYENISAETDEDVITYEITLTVKDGFLGGNDVPVLLNAGFSRDGVTDDTDDDLGELKAKNSSDFANVAISEDFDFELETHDTTIVNGESADVSDLYTVGGTLPNNWTADYVKLTAGLDGVEGDSVSPSIPTEYMLTAELAPKYKNEKAVVAQAAESVTASKPVNVDVEYSVTYNVENITPSNSENAKYLESYTTVLESGGYVLPKSITVKMGGETLDENTHYTYDSENGRVYINENVICDNITILAEASVKKYTLAFYAFDKNGELSATKSYEYEIGASLGKAAAWADSYKADADKTADRGYEFVWTWQTADGKELDEMPGQNVTVEGRYQKKSYTITVEYVYENGKTAGADVSETHLFGELYSITSPEITGYIADKPVVSGTMPAEDLEITVTYTKTETPKFALVINYEYEDGTTAKQSYSAQLEAGDEYSVTSPSIEGYKPDKAVVSGTMPEKSVNVTVTYTEDITEVTVTFDANGGSLGAGDDSRTVYCGNGRTYGELPTAVKTNAKLIGWFTEKDGGTQVTSTTVVENSKDHTLYAHWEEITASVVYNANGGKFEDGTETKSVNGTYGGSYPTLGEQPARNGYEFTGWYTDAESASKFDTESAEFVYASPRTLYAGWKLVDYAKVIFTNDAKSDVVWKTYDFEPGTSQKLDIPNPSTSLGYFKGWKNTEADDVLTLEYKKENTFTATDSTDEKQTFETTYISEWYNEGEMGKTCISNAKAQAVTLAGGKKAIRFIAVIDSGYEDYEKAGFVISTDCPTPTKEAGYRYSVQTKIYQKIWAMHPETNKGAYLDIAYLEQKIFDFSDGKGLLYTNLTIKDGNEDTIYSAAPYIVKNDGTYVYGKARTISYSELKKLDSTAG